MDNRMVDALNRSITDAQKITRRHASNPAINMKAFDAAMRLVRTLMQLRDKAERLK